MGPWAHGPIGPWARGPVGPWAHGPMGPWARGPMGPWAHGPVGPWAHGPMSPVGPWGPWAHGRTGPWAHLDPWRKTVHRVGRQSARKPTAEPLVWAMHSKQPPSEYFSLSARLNASRQQHARNCENCEVKFTLVEAFKRHNSAKTSNAVCSL